MDQHRFDHLTRRLAMETPRRSVLRWAAGGLLAAAGARLASIRASAQAIGADACTSIGARCGGGGRQPACNTCCTGFAQRQDNRQRRCACKPDQRACQRDDQCCSGLCCAIDGQKFCIPGFFTCDGRCPDESCGGETAA